MALRGQMLFQEQGWLGTKLPDVAGCAAPDRKLSFLPVHTHTPTLTAACLRTSAPARSPTASHSWASTLETPTRSQRLPGAWPELSPSSHSARTLPPSSGAGSVL